MEILPVTFNRLMAFERTAGLNLSNPAMSPIAKILSFVKRLVFKSPGRRNRQVGKKVDLAACNTRTNMLPAPTANFDGRFAFTQRPAQSTSKPLLTLPPIHQQCTSLSFHPKPIRMRQWTPFAARKLNYAAIAIRAKTKNHLLYKRMTRVSPTQGSLPTLMSPLFQRSDMKEPRFHSPLAKKTTP